MGHPSSSPLHHINSNISLTPQWRRGVGDESGVSRDYASKTLIINRIDVEDERYIYRSYKAYFVYTVDNGRDELTNEYNCKASKDETTFFDFTFLRGGNHSWMEKPRFFFPEKPVLDDIDNPFMGLCMIIREALERQVIVGAWAKLRTSRSGDVAVLTDGEFERLTDPDGRAKGILEDEVYKRWYGKLRY